MATKKTAPIALTLPNPHNPPPHYNPPAVCEKIAEQRDVMVPMRDGKRLAVDIYRPDTKGRFPALLAIAPHNKEFQTPEFAKAAQWSQPAWSRMWFGGAEGGQGLAFQNACASLSARPPRASPTTQTGHNSSGEEGTLIFANKR